MRVRFERPVTCEFVVRFEVRDHPTDPIRAELPLLLAARRFALAFDREPEPDQPVVWMATPVARDCVCEVLAAVGI